MKVIIINFKIRLDLFFIDSLATLHDIILVHVLLGDDSIET